jgi:hypothetical protein
MRKRNETHTDRQKLEETVTAAENLIALLKQFKVPIDKSTIHRIREARKHLNKTQPP